MKRLSLNSITAPTKLGVGLSIAAVCGAVALSVGLTQITAADRLVDGGYDQAIAVASSRHEPAGVPTGVLRLATHAAKVLPTFPTAATEHAWLTRPVLQGEPVQLVPVTAPAVSSVIGSSVGARFTVANADSIQTLEVVDVSEISAEQLNRNATPSNMPAKLLLVSCKIVGDVKSPGSKATDRAEVVRFIVDADLTHPVRLPRAL
jgi:hypothetical protein